MKVINRLLIIVFILSIILGIRILSATKKIGKVETEKISEINSEKLEIEEIKEIINKSEDINNYSLITNVAEEAEIKYKEGKFVFKKGNSKIFIDYEDTSEEAIIITEENKTATYVNKNSIQKINMINSNKDNFYSLIDNCESYEIKEEEIFNENSCISLTVYNKYFTGEGWLSEELKQYNGKTIEYNVLIDKNTGVIMKITSKIEDKEIINEYYYKFDCVTEEEVTVPDLSDYKIVEEY